jgi:UDP-glucose 4-epimerase
MSAFIIKLLKGEQPIIYGSGEKKRDFIYVDDVNDFHLQCITDRRTDGQTFNLGSGKNYSVNEIYRMIADLMNIHIPPVHKPDLPGEAEQTLADIVNARQFGWTPRTSINDGLVSMIDFVRNEFKKGNIR